MKILALAGSDILATQHLTRWHMVRVARQQSLAEHLATVAMFAVKIAHLWGMRDPVEILEVLDHGLTHDSHEIEWGDPPSPAVDGLPEYHDAAQDRFWSKRPALCRSPLSDHREVLEVEYSQFTRRVVKVADKLEALLFYSLEGSDPGLKSRCYDSLRKILAEFDAPLDVTLWIESLVMSVDQRTFTPQPSRPVPPLR